MYLYFLYAHAYACVTRLVRACVCVFREPWFIIIIRIPNKMHFIQSMDWIFKSCYPKWSKPNWNMFSYEMWTAEPQIVTRALKNMHEKQWLILENFMPFMLFVQHILFMQISLIWWLLNAQIWRNWYFRMIPVILQYLQYMYMFLYLHVDDFYAFYAAKIEWTNIF